MRAVRSSEVRQRQGKEDLRGGVGEDTQHSVLLSQLTRRNCKPRSAHEGPGPEDTVTNETSSPSQGVIVLQERHTMTGRYVSWKEMKFKVPWGQRGGRSKLGGVGGERERRKMKKK